MSMIDTAEKEALALLLRSKTALGRLTDAEVHSVLAYLEGIGFVHQAPAAEPVEPEPEEAIEPVEPAPLAPPPAL